MVDTGGVGDGIDRTIEASSMGGLPSVR